MKHEIYQLRRDLMSGLIPLSSLLMQAFIIAKALQKNDDVQWISDELNGYAYNSGESYPLYRSLQGQPYAFCPKYQKYILIDMNTLDLQYYTAVINDSIAKIEGLSKENIPLYYTYAEEIKKVIIKSITAEVISDVKLLITKASYMQIIECVKNKLLHWVVELEGEVGKFEVMNDTKKGNVVNHITNNINNHGDGRVSLSTIGVAEDTSVNQANNKSLWSILKNMFGIFKKLKDLAGL